MALRNFNFDVSINGIIPNIVTDAGTQGDHGVTRLNFMLTEEIYQEIVNSVVDGRVVYRFDLYNGEGGIWQSEALALVSREVGITLEEKHTRFGGKLIVYLIITSLTSNNETDIELYNYPIMLKLKNRPNGVFQEGENYQSVVSLAENVKQQVLLAEGLAETTKEYNEQAREFAALVEEKLKNGEFDGVGVKTAEIVDGELVITYSNGNSQNLGNIIGQKGDKGDKGDTPELTNYYTKDEVDNFDYADKKYVDAAVDNVNSNGIVDLTNYYTKPEVDLYHNRVTLQQQAIIKNFDNYYNKTDVDNAIDEKQDVLVSGTNVKTINGESILGSGDMVIEGITVDQTYNAKSENAQSGVAVLQATSTKADVDWIELSNPFTVEQYLFDNGTYTGVIRGIYSTGDGVRVHFYPNDQLGMQVLEEWYDSSKTPPTVEDFYNIGIEVGKAYRFVMQDNYVTSIKRCSTLSDYYTKTDVDAKLEDIEAGTVDLSDYYTKTEVDNAIAQISGSEGGSIAVDQSFSATSENAQSGKAVANALKDYYTKTEIDEAIRTKADADVTAIDMAHFAATVGIMLDDGIYIKQLNSITLMTDGTMYLSFGSFGLYSDTLTPETAGDAGLEIGKRYRIVLASEKLVSVERYATMSDKADITYVDSLIGDIETLLGGI
ncbi:MAG: hypothetical protein IJN56_08485 [Clostridia bacterium]|nr:hypothetical protein [Clostridia bacterium]